MIKEGVAGKSGIGVDPAAGSVGEPLTFPQVCHGEGTDKFHPGIPGWTQPDGVLQSIDGLSTIAQPANFPQGARLGHK